jgi:hypothetical protein
MTSKLIAEIRRKGLKKRRGRKNAIFWREKDFLDGPAEAGIIILPTIGCSWARDTGCTMCGYVYDSPAEIEQSDLIREFDVALAQLRGVKYLKIFTSGSFLDTEEISIDTRKGILSKINQHRIERVQIESRPEFIHEKELQEIRGYLKPELEIGIGLETADDFIRDKFINKGFTLKDFKSAVRTCKAVGAKVKSYILLKPPFVGERKAIEDAIRSSIEAFKIGVDRVSLNPVNIQKYTLVEELWRHGEYRPPWLWSVVETLKKVKEKVEKPILSHPIAAGKSRGPHNCGKCDSSVYKAIINFSITQDLRHLHILHCSCIEKWRDILELEDFNH